MRKLVSLVGMLVLCSASWAADVVTLNNGDKISGTIQEVNSAAVLVTTTYAGKLTIERTAVKTLQSEKPVKVVSQDGQTGEKYLSPVASGKGWLETPTAVIGPPRHTSYLALGPDWKNQLALGVVNTTGNDQTTTLTADLSLHYSKKPDDLTIKVNGLYGKSNGRQTAGLLSEASVYRHDINDKWYGYLDEEARYDSNKGISVQATGTAGLGYWIVQTDKLKVDLRGGPGVTYIKTFDDESTVSPAGESGIRVSYVFNDHVSGTHETVYTAALNDMQIWRIHSETALLVKLDLESGLGLKLAFDDDYENQPAMGRKRNDTRTTLSLTLDF